ncbi:hypothetical protein LCGC14_2200930 [marine sediment metagenome]|uniref:Uncharacterized protein n=1 Tax=marine sediment metagenome TaxID=412755 RepID=A0A0F9GCK3_9ZZZZ
MDELTKDYKDRMEQGMKCRYCNNPNTEWRVELGLFVCDQDYAFPPLEVDDEGRSGHKQRYEYQLLRMERSIRDAQ